MGDKKVLELDGGDGHTIAHTYLTPLGQAL